VSVVNGCYYLLLDALVQNAANQRCISLHPNSHLVVINSAAEQTALSDWLYQFSEYSAEKYATFLPVRRSRLSSNVAALEQNIRYR